jgi:hypothetical protein
VTNLAVCCLFHLDCCTGHTDSNSDINLTQLKFSQKKHVMMLCDGCNGGFHLVCVKKTIDKTCAVPQTKTWYCHMCAVPCEQCNKFDEYGPASRRLLRCRTCAKSWHMHCLHKKLTDEPKGSWRCLACESSTRVTRAVAAKLACPGCQANIGSEDKNACVCSVCDRKWHCKSPCVSKLHRPTDKEKKGGWKCPECKGVKRTSTAK